MSAFLRTEPVKRDSASAVLAAESLRSLFAQYSSDHEDQVGYASR